MKHVRAVGPLLVVCLTVTAFACNNLMALDDFRLCSGAECGDAGADVGSQDLDASRGEEASRSEDSGDRFDGADGRTDAPDALPDAGPPPPSCQGLEKTCGADASDDCCASLLVEGGTFSLGVVNSDNLDAGAAPATLAHVSSFRLDKYLVTVGRFRKFIDAFVTQGWSPTLGSGKHSHLDGGGLPGEPGWATAFGLPSHTMRAVEDGISSCSFWVAAGSSYDPTPQPEVETRAMNCVTWAQAYAFCIWDGGFLPTYAELNYAAAGGAEQRVYPWSSPPDSSAIDWRRANYGTGPSEYRCTGDPLFDGGVHDCTKGDYVPVGSKSGYGRWGQTDLVGYLHERTLDCEPTFDGGACNDCVHDVPCASNRRVTFGGNYGDTPEALRTSVYRVEDSAAHQWQGFRCARPPR